MHASVGKAIFQMRGMLRRLNQRGIGMPAGGSLRLCAPPPEQSCILFYSAARSWKTLPVTDIRILLHVAGPSKQPNWERQ